MLLSFCLERNEYPKHAADCFRSARQTAFRLRKATNTCHALIKELQHPEPPTEIQQNFVFFFDTVLPG